MSKATFEVTGLFLLVIGIVATGWYWLERVHVLKTTVTVDLINVFKGPNQNIAEVDVSNDVLLLDKLRLEKKEEQLKILQIDLSQQQLDLEAQKQNLSDDFATIAATKTEIEEMKKSLNQISNELENKNERIRQTSIALMNMPPRNAVDILQEYSDELIIETFAAVNQISDEQGKDSIVPFWLSLMDSTRAGNVQEKIVYNSR